MCVCEYIQGHVCASVRACVRTCMPCVCVGNVFRAHAQNVTSYI